MRGTVAVLVSPRLMEETWALSSGYPILRDQQTSHLRACWLTLLLFADPCG